MDNMHGRLGACPNLGSKVRQTAASVLKALKQTSLALGSENEPIIDQML